MHQSQPYSIVPIGPSLHSEIQRLLDEAWHGPFLVVNGKQWDTRTLPGFAALDVDGGVLGYLLYVFHDGVCEIMALQSVRENAGIGSRLIERVRAAAREQSTSILTVTTTNDNIRAIRFYQKRGFTLRALRLNIMETSRRLKPAIPLIGKDGIPLRDEIEFEIEI